VLGGYIWRTYLGAVAIQQRLDRILQQTVKNKYVFGAVARVATADRRLRWTSAAGDLDIDSPYFIASTTKLYITAVMIQLRAEGKVSFDDRCVSYLRAEDRAGLHVYKGRDCSSEILVSHLLSHRSGLPDYFQYKRASGKSLQDELLAGQDRGWRYETVLADVKEMKPAFRPGTPGKAMYSDTNFQILGRIIESVTGEKIGAVLRKRIFEPLELSQTYLYEDPADTTPHDIYYRSRPMRIPEAMASFGPDGGIVSTSAESMRFLRAFFEGELFAKEELPALMDWNAIFFPFEYGVGIARFKLPRLFSPFKSVPEFIGHSGLSGAFAFYCPAKAVYLTGTVNQAAKPGLAFRMLVRMANAVR
jgi:D-alanyl-D-alanine carboxypeptidase